jgi:hypothetical protein
MFCCRHLVFGARVRQIGTNVSEESTVSLFRVLNTPAADPCDMLYTLHSTTVTYSNTFWLTAFHFAIEINPKIPMSRIMTPYNPVKQ